MHLLKITSSIFFLLTTNAQGVAWANQTNSLPKMSLNKEIEQISKEESSEARVLVSEIHINGTGENIELEQTVIQAIETQAGLPTTVSQIRNDINSIYATGLFANVVATPEDTPLGVRVTYEVVPNPVLTVVTVQALPLDDSKNITSPEIVQEIFGDRYGEIINLNDFQEGSGKLGQLERWYQDNGFDLAKAIGIDDPTPDGQVILVVVEGVIEDIRVNFINSDSEPVDGKTRNFIITREMELKPGDVFRRDMAQRDLQRIFGLGLFEDVQLDFTTGEKDPTKAILNFNVNEANTARYMFGVRVSTQTGFGPTAEYQEDNFRGFAQKISSELEFGLSQLSFVGETVSPGSQSDPDPKNPINRLGLLALTSLQNNSLASQSLQSTKYMMSDPDRFLDSYKNIFSGSYQNRTYDQDDFISIVLNNENPSLKSDSFSTEKYLKHAVELSRREDFLPEEVLTLLNLGDYYLKNKKYASAINVYKKSALLLQELDSPLLKLFTHLKLAETYSKENFLEDELYSLYEILRLTKLLKNKKNSDKILGEQFQQALKEDWIELPDLNLQSIQKYWQPAIHLIELTTLLDIFSTYKHMGDYQQALYILNSPQLKENTLLLSKLLPQLIEKELEVQEFVEENLIPDSWTESQKENLHQLIDESILDLKQEVENFTKDVPSLMESFSRDFIYSDLNQTYLVNSNQEKVNPRLHRINIWSLDTLKELSVFFKDNSIFLDSQNQELKGLSTTVFAHVLDLLSLEFTGEDKFSSKDNLRDSLDALISYLNEENTSLVNLNGITTVELSDILPKALELIFDPNNSEESKATLRHLLKDIISQENLPDHLLWVKRISLLMQADDYRQIGEFEKSIKAYESAFALSPLDERQVQKTISSFVSTDVSSALTFQTEIINEAGDTEKTKLNPNSFFDSPIVNMFLDLFYGDSSFMELQFHVELANLYYQKDDFLNSKEYYLKAFSLIENVEDINFSKIKPGVISEMYYGLARAEQALGNIENTEKYIQASQNIINSFYNDSVSQNNERALTFDFRYGYGEPKLGFLRANINVNSSNSWFAQQNRENSDESIGKENSQLFASLFGFDSSIDEPPCYTSSEYFECRQKYYELSVGLLVEKHKKDTSFGFDKLAFESAENARVRSPQILQNIAKESKNEEYLLQRRQALTTPSTLEEIQETALDDETVLISYFLGIEKSYLWLVSKHKPLETIELPARSILESKAREFYDLLTEPSGRVRPQTTAKVGKELSSLILEPIAEKIAGKRLLIVGDGFLQYLPFSALPHPTLKPEILTSSEEAGEYTAYLRPLILDHEIIMLPSASSLVAIRNSQIGRTSPSKELAIFADPIFNHKDKRVKDISINSNLASFGNEDLENIDILHGTIPNTIQELSSIKELLSPEKQESFSGFEASRDTAFNEGLGDFRIVHFATHGIFNSQAPERSGVVLSNINNQFELQPGLLSPLDTFSKMNLSGTELVVLSGCRTGFGSGQINREGLTGLTGGLLSAGSDRVVASLWSVQDNATRELMTRFYSLMLNTNGNEPMTASQALREAQLSMWREPKWQTPYYWSSFIMQGEWQ